MQAHHKKIVFAITSTGNDLYSAMTRVAVASVRITNPNIVIYICCDEETDRISRTTNNTLFNEVDEWFPVSTPKGNASFRNRFIKTNLRKIFKGNFLFLDSDVLVRGDLSPLFDLDTDIAAARNHSLPDYSEQIWKKDTDILKRLAWTTLPDVYVNGGVMLYQNTTGAYQFAEEWHRLWFQGIKTHSDHRDQPALNAALHATQAKFYLLPDCFNAQFKCNVKTIPNAKIWHYYYSRNEGIPYTLFDKMTQGLMNGEKLQFQKVKQLIDAPHPWCAQGYLSKLVFAHGLVHGSLSDLESAFLRKDLLGYCYLKIKNLYSRSK